MKKLTSFPNHFDDHAAHKKDGAGEKAEPSGRLFVPNRGRPTNKNTTYCKANAMNDFHGNLPLFLLLMDGAALGGLVVALAVRFQCFTFAIEPF